jgi:hypothetical protein
MIPASPEWATCGFSAEVAELADAQASGACARKGVKVRVLSSAPQIEKARFTGPFRVSGQKIDHI